MTQPATAASPATPAIAPKAIRKLPKSNITTKPLSAFSATAARISMAAGGLFLVLLASLHVIEPQFSPSWRYISEYELGRYGWLMVIAFLALMVSAASLFAAVSSQVRTVGGYIGLAVLLVCAGAFGLAAVFTTDPVTAVSATAHGKIHSTAALLGGNLPLAAYLLGWSLARNKAWVHERMTLLRITAIAIAANVATLVMSVIAARSAHAKPGPSVPIGWPNRILIAAFAVWLLAFSWRLLRHRRQDTTVS